jgi:hypothetical protein
MSSTGRPIGPLGGLALDSGKVLAYTAGTSPAFRPLALRLNLGSVEAANEGAARFSVGWDGLYVQSGTVARDGGVQPPTGGDLTCGDGRLVPIPPVPSASPSDSPSTSPSDSPSPSPSPSTSPSDTLTPTQTPTKGATKTPTTRPTTKAPTPSPTQSRDLTPPVITNGHALESPIAQNPPTGYHCVGGKATQIAEGVYADVADPDDAQTLLNVYFTWSLSADGTGGTGPMTIGDGIFAGGFKVDYAQSHLQGGTITITEHATDPAGNAATPVTFTVALDVCRIAAN